MGLLDRFQTLFKGGKVDVHLRFELLTEGQSGTMSRFHKARDRESNRVVGVKLLDTEKTAQFEMRFRGLNKPHEGEIALQLKHTNVVETYEHGISTKDQRFIVMEFINGPGLQTLIRLQDPRLNGKGFTLIRQSWWCWI